MSTRAQILAEIAAQFPDNTTGLITPAKLRQVVEDVTNSCLVSDTDAGTAGIAALQAETPAQLRTAAGLAGLSTTGLIARTGAGTAATRTITGTANQVIVANGDGVSGNPTLSLPQSIATTSTPTFANLSIPSGSVGVGTSSPQAHLHVGSAETDLATYGGELKIFTGANASLESVGGIELPVATNGYGVKIQALSADGSALAFANRNGVATWTERMRISAEGFVGIGTTAPSSVFHVERGSGTLPALRNDHTNIRISASDAAPAAIEGISFGQAGFSLRGVAAGGTRSVPTATEADRPILSLNAYGYDGTAYSDYQALYRIAADGLWSGTNRGTYYAWVGTSNESTTPAEWMRLGNGSLSIGATSATTTNKLFVNSLDASRVMFAGSTKGIRFTHNTTGSVIEGVDNTGSASYQPLYVGGSYVAMTISGTEKMRVDSTGALRLFAYGAGTLVTDSSGNVTASSDVSLKTVTGSFTRGLVDVLKLTPRTYHWNEKSGMNTEDENVGFIAQEVLAAVPEAVGQFRTVETEDKDGKKAKKREAAEILTLSDRPLIAALVNAVKELKAENDELSTRIAKLETKK